MSDTIQTVKCYLRSVFKNVGIVKDIQKYVLGYSANSCLASYVCTLVLHSILTDKSYDTLKQLALLSCINETFAGRCYLSCSKKNFKFYNRPRDREFGENAKILKQLVVRYATLLKSVYKENHNEDPSWFNVKISFFRYYWAKNVIKEAKTNAVEHLWSRIFRWLKHVYYDSSVKCIPNIDNETRKDELRSIAELDVDQRSEAISRRSYSVLKYLFSEQINCVSNESVAALQALADYFGRVNLKEMILQRHKNWQQCLYLMYKLLRSFGEHKKKAFALWPVSNPTIKHVLFDERCFVELIVNKHCDEKAQPKVSYKECVYTVDGKNKRGRRKRTKAEANIESDAIAKKRRRTSETNGKDQRGLLVEDETPAMKCWTYEEKCSLWTKYAEGLHKKIRKAKNGKKFNFSFTTNGHDISLHFSKPQRSATVRFNERYDRIYGVDPGKIKLISAVNVLDAAPEDTKSFVSVKSRNYRHKTQQVHRNEFLRVMKLKHGITTLENYAENVKRRTGIYEEFERFALQQTKNINAFIDFYRRKDILSLKFKNMQSKEKELSNIVKAVLKFGEKRNAVRKLKPEGTSDKVEVKENVLIGFGDGDKRFFNSSRGWQSGPLCDLERKIKSFRTPYFNITLSEVDERYTSQNCCKCLARKTMKFEKEQKLIFRKNRATREVTCRTKLVQSREEACQSCGLCIDRDNNACYNIGMLAKITLVEKKARPKRFCVYC